MPHMRPEDRRDTFRRLSRIVGNTERPRRATLADIAGLGIEVVPVNAEGAPAGDGTAGDATGGEA